MMAGVLLAPQAFACSLLLLAAASSTNAAQGGTTIYTHTTHVFANGVAQ
jgi:hypothetical protein